MPALVESRQPAEVDWNQLDKRKFAQYGAVLFTGVTSMLYPLSVIKTRQMALPGIPGGFQGVKHTASGIWRADGGKGFYRGFSTVIVGTIPGRSVYLTTLEFVKTHVSNASEPFQLSDATRAGAANFVGGAVASLATQAVTVPVDVVSQRQMVHGSEPLGTGPAPSASRAAIHRDALAAPLSAVPTTTAAATTAAVPAVQPAQPTVAPATVPTSPPSPPPPAQPRPATAALLQRHGASSTLVHASPSPTNAGAAIAAGRVSPAVSAPPHSHLHTSAAPMHSLHPSSSCRAAYSTLTSYRSTRIAAAITSQHHAVTIGTAPAMPLSTAKRLLGTSSSTSVGTASEGLQTAGTGSRSGAGAGLTPGSSQRVSGLHVARSILKAEGLGGLYRGFGASVATFVPSSAIWWGSYGTYQQVLWSVYDFACASFPTAQAETGSSGNAGDAAASIPHSSSRIAAAVQSSAGMGASSTSTSEVVAIQTLASVMAGATSSTLTNPLDLIKTRIQVAAKQEGQMPATIRSVLTHILKEEGPKGLLRGLLPRMVSACVWGSSMLAVYELLKRLSVKDEVKEAA